MRKFRMLRSRLARLSGAGSLAETASSGNGRKTTRPGLSTPVRGNRRPAARPEVASTKTGAALVLGTIVSEKFGLIPSKSSSSLA